ncbi:MAG: polysaccharide deacetylase family protein [Bacteroidota bacterium]|nr:polysaccharide deacetylase family protein [Bacteroidota bacterium]
MQTQNLTPKIITLMYHRIDDADADPWGICVSPENFEKQIESLKENFNVISVAEMVTQVCTRNITGNSVCVTFDDGYTDNYLHAKPVLEKYNCPATFFIATAFTNQSTGFWWDELEIIFLHIEKLPAYLSLEINHTACEYFLEASQITPHQLFLHKQWRWYEPPPTDRCKVFLDIWEKLSPLPYKKIKSVIDNVKQWAAQKIEITESRLPMNDQQIFALSNNHLFTIALHSDSHSDLSQIKKDCVVEEIQSCQKSIYMKYGVESSFLSYPFGRYNGDTIDAVEDLHLSACFTTEAIWTEADADFTRLGRFQVFNRNTETFKNQLDCWFKKPYG